MHVFPLLCYFIKDFVCVSVLKGLYKSSNRLFYGIVEGGRLRVANILTIFFVLWKNEEKVTKKSIRNGFWVYMTWFGWDQSAAKKDTAAPIPHVVTKHVPILSFCTVKQAVWTCHVPYQLVFNPFSLSVRLSSPLLHCFPTIYKLSPHSSLSGFRSKLSLAQWHISIIYLFSSEVVCRTQTKTYGCWKDDDRREMTDTQMKYGDNSRKRHNSE